MAHTPKLSFVDWSLINIWCCGQFFTPSEISRHTEQVHCEQDNDLPDLVNTHKNLKETEGMISVSTKSENNNQILKANQEEQSPKRTKNDEVVKSLTETKTDKNSGASRDETETQVIATKDNVKAPAGSFVWTSWETDEEMLPYGWTKRSYANAKNVKVFQYRENGKKHRKIFQSKKEVFVFMKKSKTYSLDDALKFLSFAKKMEDRNDASSLLKDPIPYADEIRYKCNECGSDNLKKVNLYYHVQSNHLDLHSDDQVTFDAQVPEFDEINAQTGAKEATRKEIKDKDDLEEEPELVAKKLKSCEICEFPFINLVCQENAAVHFYSEHLEEMDEMWKDFIGTDKGKQNCGLCGHAQEYKDKSEIKLHIFNDHSDEFVKKVSSTGYFSSSMLQLLRIKLPAELVNSLQEKVLDEDIEDHSDDGLENASSCNNNQQTDFEESKTTEDWVVDPTLPEGWKRRPLIDHSNQKKGDSIMVVTKYQYMSPDQLLFDSRKEVYAHIPSQEQILQLSEDYSQEDDLQDEIDEDKQSEYDSQFSNLEQDDGLKSFGDDTLTSQKTKKSINMKFQNTRDNFSSTKNCSVELSNVDVRKYLINSKVEVRSKNHSAISVPNYVDLDLLESSVEVTPEINTNSQINDNDVNWTPLVSELSKDDAVKLVTAPGNKGKIEI